MFNRIKRMHSYTAQAQFLAECDLRPIGYIARQADIPSPYVYSSHWAVHNWRGRNVIIRETSHRCFDVFAVPSTETIFPDLP